MIRVARHRRSSGAAELSALLGRLDEYSDGSVALRAPSPAEAIALYSVAVRVAQVQLAHAGPDPRNLAATRDALLATRRLLRAALDRIEGDPGEPGNPADPGEPGGPPRLVVLDGGVAN